MSLAEIQKLTARLYTDSELRRAFLAAPEKIGREFDLTENEISELAEVLPAELNFFADALFYKRLREVEKLLPKSQQSLKADFERHFRDFSATFLPASIKKHLEDAIRFADYLTNKIDENRLRDLIRFEQANLIFHGFGKRLLIRRFNFDPREIARSDAKTQRKSTVAVWFKIGEKVRHFIR